MRAPALRPVWRAAAAAAVLLVTLAAPPARAQFSPGKLSRAHAGLEGPTACFRCHEPRKATTPERCLKCHVELRARIDAGRGYHGRMGAGERAVCSKCHPEHAGVEAALVHWPDGRREVFDHRRTGWPLDGRHTALRCEACHAPEHIRAADVREEQAVKMQRTHLGLSTRCADCHRDPHRGQFEAQVKAGDCTTCHTTAAWKIEPFDHARTRFALAGRHARLACAKCHPSVNEAGTRVAAGTAGAFVRWRPLEFAACSACHEDPHRGRLGAACASCHTPQGWKDVSMAGFDHGRTRFALVGKHAAVECTRCHYPVNAAGARVAAGSPGAQPRWKPLEFASCTACHRDPHASRFGLDCTRCHSPQSWKAIPAGAFDHDRTDYPLRGAHARVECQKCHAGGDFKKKLAFARCRDCHRDVHDGQLAQRGDGGACESCHGVEGFLPARYGGLEHDRSRFPLRGAHRAVACNACHRPTREGAPRGSVRFRFESNACAACHTDPHAAQFAVQGTTDCARCHAETGWKLPRFDHDRQTRFRLEGAHARTACTACHKPQKVGERTVVRWRPLDTACRACHAEPRPLNAVPRSPGRG